MATYNITIFDSGVRTLKKVKGKAIVLEGFEQFDFFYHKSDDGVLHCITEYRTGGQVAISNTYGNCIYLALKNLKKLGAEKVKQKLDDQLYINGFEANTASNKKQDAAIRKDADEKAE